MEVTLFKTKLRFKRAGGSRLRRVGNRASELGFTIVEVIIASAIFTIVSASLLGLFAYSLSTMQLSQDEMIARQKAREILEDIFAARNSGQISWSMIEGTLNNGIFVEGVVPKVPGPMPMLTAGNDGIIGTKDDGPSLDTLVYPGKDGILGTADDITVALSNFQRQIEIIDVTRKDSNNKDVLISDVRQVKVTVTYSVPQFGVRSYVVSAFVSEYR